MPNSRSNKDYRQNTGVVRGEFPMKMHNDERKAEELVEENSIGGKLAKERKKRKNTLESIMKGSYE